MKLIPAVFLLSLTFSTIASADAGVTSFTTRNGKTFRNVSISKVDPDGITFTHSKGMARILYADVPSASRAQLGYDPARAAAHEKQLVVKRETEARLQAERRKAYMAAAARHAEARREEMMIQQLGLAAGAQGYGYNYGGSYPVAVSSMGLMNGMYQTPRGYNGGRVPQGHQVYRDQHGRPLQNTVLTSGVVFPTQAGCAPGTGFNRITSRAPQHIAPARALIQSATLSPAPAMGRAVPAMGRPSAPMSVRR